MYKTIRSFFKNHFALNSIGLAILFILIEGLYSFCSKPKMVDCPAFADTRFDSWFPYHPTQKIYFTSSQSRADTLTIADVYKSPAFQGTAGSCSMNAQIMSREAEPFPNLSITYSTFAGNNNLSLALYNFQAFGSLTEDSYTPGNSEKSELLASTVINGRSFNNVVQIALDTNLIKQEGIYKIWLSKQTGLVGYERYPSLEQFVKQ